VKHTRLFVALILAASLISAPAFATAKAGAKCTKVGTTATVGGKKFTCVKSGTKLVWNKGVAIKAAPTTSKLPESKSLLASDSRISPISLLSSLETCKTEDQTPWFMADGSKANGNGFPRPAFTVTGKKKAKILVIPMIFNDVPFLEQLGQGAQGTSSDLDDLNRVIKAVPEQIKQLSAQRFEVSIDVLPKSEWWVINKNHPFALTWGIPNGPALEEIIAEHKKDFVFEGYDTYAFVTGRRFAGQNRDGSAQAAFAKAKNSKTGYVNGMLMIGTMRYDTWWVHELGHTLFALEDLYLFDFNSQGTTSDVAQGLKFPFNWDLMADADKSVLLEWNRFLIGWLLDTEVRCIAEQKSSVHYLSNLDTGTHPKLLTITLSPGVTLAAEARTGLKEGSGLLLYLINSHIQQGNGPIVAHNSLVSKGESKSWMGWDFKVLESDIDGLLVEAIKTDVDKFVPPSPKPQPTTAAPQTSKIRVTKGEVVTTGYLQARATWEVTGHESYRVYVTAADDNQKVFFESRILNGSQNPIVVNITGLPCNREIRTVSMFFAEKDGKGESVVRESKELAVTPCRAP
jgi:hypothetical protein